MRFSLSIVFIVVLGFSTVAQQQLNPGQVIDSVYCTSDNSHSYSLYLPSTYAADRAWPIVFIFDAGGRGKLAVEKFQAGAEQHGFILIGSNNFRNGPMDQAFEAANRLFEDAQSRYPIDGDRLYTAGLSGGARVATAIATLVPDVDGVIACAAGEHSQYPITDEHAFTFVSVVGHTDMNLYEVEVLHRRITNSQMNHVMINFDGGHGWADDETLSTALEWIKAYSEGSAIDMEFPNAQPGQFDAETLTRHQQEGQWQNDLAYPLFRLEGPDAAGAVTELTAQINSLINIERTAKTNHERLMANRLLGYIALYTVSNGGSRLGQQQFEQAIPFYQVLAQTHPKNAHMWFFVAKLNAQANQKAAALKAYNKALKQGFEGDPSLSKKEVYAWLQDEADLQALLWKGLPAFF